MKLMRILVLLVFFTITMGRTQIFANKDFDYGQPSGGGESVMLCSWCVNDSGHNNGNYDINWDQDYRARYKMEFEKKSPKLEEPVAMDKARHLVDNYIYLSGIPDLKPGKIIEKDNEFDAEIIKKDGSSLGTIVIDKQTGEIKSPY
jgi:hypothetical protein